MGKVKKRFKKNDLVRGTKKDKPSNGDLIKKAESLGYKPTKEKAHGQIIFKSVNGHSFISFDVDSHNGGFWKKASSIKKLQSKASREGTYDEDLNKIGK